MRVYPLREYREVIVANKEMLTVVKIYSCNELILRESFDLSVKGIELGLRRANPESEKRFDPQTVIVSAEGRGQINENVAERLTQLESGKVPIGSSRVLSLSASTIDSARAV